MDGSVNFDLSSVDVWRNTYTIFRGIPKTSEVWKGAGSVHLTHSRLRVIVIDPDELRRLPNGCYMVRMVFRTPHALYDKILHGVGLDEEAIATYSLPAADSEDDE